MDEFPFKVGNGVVLDKTLELAAGVPVREAADVVSF